jgi:hypothetical protein
MMVILDAEKPQGRRLPMTIADAVGMVSALAAAISAIFAFLTTRQARKQIQAADRSVEAAVFLEIQARWNEIYPRYRALLKNSFDTGALVASATSFEDYSVSDEWQKMRPVFAFHEFLGACLEAGLLSETTLFSLVAVNPRLWEKYRPIIVHFRREQPELYRAWESLVARKERYAAASRLSGTTPGPAEALEAVNDG